ncbi:phosphatase PAP2 family protein [uncultured Ruminococcus sp.]|uniref:phosphatase PAP2 family protein n=1 Tax=uncultured Ruminococcus sp. TaxID=165186 RepID=UPI00292EDAAB|nr:phosphatase PAP2 family protein [uncultured Ruminococcus sp.]
MFRKLRILDERVVERMSQIHRPVLDKLMVMFTYAGTGGFIWWILFILPFLISRPYRRTGIILTAAIGFNYVLGEIIIKKTVGRARPSTLIADEDMKIHKPKDHSFPSGHSASSFCAFSVMFWCCPVWIWLPALALAGTIAFSRMYLRVHYLTDVIGGVLLGLIDGSLMTLFFHSVVFTQG